MADFYKFCGRAGHGGEKFFRPVAGHGGTAMPCHATACGGIRHGDLHPCHGEEPTGYANVAAHVDWIHQVMSDK